MNKLKKYIAAVLLCAAVMLLAPSAAFAVGVIDPKHDASLTIDYHYGDTPISGATFSLYRIADVDRACTFTLTEQFAKYPVEVNGNTVESWNKLAETLKGYVLYDSVKPYISGITGSTGTIRFGGIPTGLYLVTGNSRTLGDYTYYCQAAIIAVPGLDGDTGEWLYDVTADPKCSRKDFEEPDDKTVTRKVIKVWEDNNSKDRPKEVVIQLYCGKTLYDTVTLNAANNWRHARDNLPAYAADKTKNEWSIVEKPVDGYNVVVKKDGITFTVTNSKKTTPPEDPKLPQTGMLWWPVPVLLFAGLVLVLIGTIRRRGSYNE